MLTLQRRKKKEEGGRSRRKAPGSASAVVFGNHLCVHLLAGWYLSGFAEQILAFEYSARTYVRACVCVCVCAPWGPSEEEETRRQFDMFLSPSSTPCILSLVISTPTKSVTVLQASFPLASI